MDTIATIKTFCSGPTGTNEMLEALKGHNGSWGGNVDMTHPNKVEVPKETKGWFVPMEGATDIFREMKDGVCCVCKEKVKVSPTFWSKK